MVMETHVMIFWVMTPYNDLQPEDDSIMALQNGGILPHHYMVS